MALTETVVRLGERMSDVSIGGNNKIRETDSTKHVYRKISARLLPLLLLGYIAASLDKVNVSFAELRMSSDLGFSNAVYGFGAGVFFLGYFLFEFPSNLFMHRIGAKATLSRIMLLWATLSGLFAVVQTPLSFYILRFLLGAAEAGFFPGVMLYLTYWFPSFRRARATAVFIIAMPLAGVIGSPLSAWILSSTHGAAGLDSWRWLFIIEAVPSLIIGILILGFLTNTPDDASWLTESERNIVNGDLSRELDYAKGSTSSSLVSVFKNKWVILLIVLSFCEGSGVYGITFWLPHLISSAGISDVSGTALITSVPYSVGVIAMILFARSSDKRLERRHHLALVFVIGAVGLVTSALAGSHHPIVGIAALCLATAGAYSALSLFWNYPGAFMTGIGAAGGFAVVNSLGNLSGFVSPYGMGLMETLTGSTSSGVYVLAAVMGVGAGVAYLAPRSIVNK